jgi:mannosyltransferase
MVETSIQKRAVSATGRKARLLTLLKNVIPRSHLLIDALIFLIALGINCYRLGTPSLWFDEAYSVELVRHPFSQVWTIIFSWQPNMELYYVLLYGWLHLLATFGWAATEFAVRFPSALSAALSAVVVFAFGRRFISAGAGAIGALLYILNPRELVYSQQTRAYGLQLLLLCLSWYVLFAALTSKRRWSRYWIGFVIVMILAIYTHLMSGIMLMTQIIVVGGMLLFSNWRTFIWQRIPAFLVSLVVIGFALLPLLPVVRHGDATGSWLLAPKLRDLVWIFQIITGGDKLYLFLTAASMLLGLLIIGLSIVLRTSRGQALLARQLEQRQVLHDLLSHEYSSMVIWGLLCWLFVPVILSFVISKTVIHVFSERYLVVIIPAFCLLVGLGVAALRGRTLPLRAIQLILAACLLGLTVHLAVTYYAGAQVEDWHSSAQWVMDRYQQHDGLVCYDNNQGCQISMEYYFQTYPRNGAHFDPDTPGATLFWSPAYFAKNWEAITPSIVSAFAAKHHRLFYITGRAPENQVRGMWQWLDQHYRLIGQVHTSGGISVRLYEIRA